MTDKEKARVRLRVFTDVIELCGEGLGEKIPPGEVLQAETEAYAEIAAAIRSLMERPAVPAEPDACDNCSNPMDGETAATSDVCLDCWRDTSAALSRALLLLSRYICRLDPMPSGSMNGDTQEFLRERGIDADTLAEEFYASLKEAF